jgi:hypothetical protein
MISEPHFVPPFVVPRATPLLKAEFTPTAWQAVTDAQAMPLREADVCGMLWDFQVAPPFVVPRATPSPVLL